ncbi:ATP-binding protein [Acanthopleuribacter pedis]|uniref:DNA topoisomerase (ATP-hydrolyzing) n=1 Tax=Acanthopleuribacter pedis TaxID=442870 RepID=A0A8J7U6E2_9BACT|nr:ATP-binding protein [Acanthopleuribacter pedis]MBO1321824.1 hypothetical protein [Acanthopleuribacter pedis]
MEHDREAVRKRPGMYVGNTDNGDGVLQILWEVVGNAFDQYLQGLATSVQVRIEDNRVMVRDDGAGIAPFYEDGRPRLIPFITEIRDTATADGHFPHVHLVFGSSGLGLAPVSFLSKEFELQTVWGGTRYRVHCRDGHLQGDLIDEGPDTGRGTTVSFSPDPAIFGCISYPLDHVKERLGHLAAFYPDYQVRFQGEAIRRPRGLLELLDEGTEGLTPLGEPLSVAGEARGIRVFCVWQWYPGERPRDGSVLSFLNHAVTVAHGTHVSGFLDCLRRELGEAAETAGCDPAAFDPTQNVHAVIHAFMAEPRFGGPTRDHLKSPEVAEVMDHLVSARLKTLIAEKPTWFNRLLAGR